MLLEEGGPVDASADLAPKRNVPGDADSEGLAPKRVELLSFPEPLELKLKRGLELDEASFVFALAKGFDEFSEAPGPEDFPASKLKRGLDGVVLVVEAPKRPTFSLFGFVGDGDVMFTIGAEVEAPNLIGESGFQV